MNPAPLVFNATIAHQYDACLGPFLFEPYAFDLVERTELSGVAHVLELACGTGRVTRHLLAHLPPAARLTATDLNAGMLALAQEKLSATNVTWATADMAKLPYEDNQFDLVACQFGVMFVPDKQQAFTEMNRVLRPGGQLVLNTWGPLPKTACGPLPAP